MNNLFNSLKQKTHILLLVICVFLMLNFINTCSNNKRVIELSNKLDSATVSIYNIQYNSDNILLLEIDRKLSENLIYQRQLFDKQLSIDSINIRLKNTTIQLQKMKQLTKNAKK